MIFKRTIVYTTRFSNLLVWCIVRFTFYSLAIWDEEHGKMRPLDDRLLTRVTVNWTSLTELITLEGGLLATLYAKNCITYIQRKSIESAGNDIDQNKRLLEIMSKKSVAVFNRFIEYLQETQQGHVAAILLNEDAGN